MATKSEIKEWLEACGAGATGVIAYQSPNMHFPWVIRVSEHNLCGESVTILHLLNESLTGVQGPTFAEWKKQKGREGKILKIMDAYNEDSLYGHMGPAMAAKILDAIEGEGE